MLSRLLFCLCFIFAARGFAAPFINEFHAENVGPVLTSVGTIAGAEDLDANSSDWIELRNPDAASVNLAGWALSDDPALPGKWVFPSGSIATNGYLIVFASGKNGNLNSQQLHTNFKLANSGVILLSQPAGAGAWTVVHQIGTTAVPYPPQKQRFSYGYGGTSGPLGALGYLERQTPRREDS